MVVLHKVGLRLVSSHGTVIDYPEVIDDRPLEAALKSVTRERMFTLYLLLEHEAAALFLALRGRYYTPERLEAGISFLRMVNPYNKKSGWSDEQLMLYVCRAMATFDHEEWAKGLYQRLDVTIKEVAQRTRNGTFHKPFLRAALFFFATGYQIEQQSRRTG